MPATKTAGAAASKKAAPAHASFKDMVKDAIINLKERNGASRQAIKKYVKANNTLGDLTDNSINIHISKALETGEKAGDFARPKGPSGPVKLAKKGPATKPAAKPIDAKVEKAEKKPAAKSTTVKKTSATKAAPKSKAAVSKKSAAVPKKPAATKANTAKPRKAAPKKPVAAPAIVPKEAVLSKTKSGRVTKSTAPTPTAAKKTAAKKAAPKKAATKKSPAKKATPAK